MTFWTLFQIVLDIWKTSDVRTDKSNRWFNVLLRKEKQDE